MLRLLVYMIFLLSTLRYVHPSIAVHMKTLFNLMLLHGYVPDKLG